MDRRDKSSELSLNDTLPGKNSNLDLTTTMRELALELTQSSLSASADLTEPIAISNHIDSDDDQNHSLLARLKSRSKNLTDEEKKTMCALAGFGLMMSFLMILFVGYGSNGLPVLWLSIKSVFSMADDSEHRRLIELCKEVNQLDCAAKAHEKLAQNDFLANASAGHFFLLKRDYTKALAHYERYFTAHPKDLNAAFDYARLLSWDGRRMEADKYYLMVINAKPNMLQHTVAESYVRHLLKYNDAETAKKFLRKWRSKGENASYFLESEWRSLVSPKDQFI